MSNGFWDSLISLGILEDWYLDRNEQKIESHFFVILHLTNKTDQASKQWFLKSLEGGHKVQSIYLLNKTSTRPNIWDFQRPHPEDQWKGQP